MTPVGYCANVHPASGINDVLAVIERHGRKVREMAGLPAMQIGLWLPAQAARFLGRKREWQEQFRAALSDAGLEVRTINAFPFTDFHQPVVKQRVYAPSWLDPRRREHTVRVAKALASLLPEGGRGSISTVPLGIREEFASQEARDAAAVELGRTAAELCRLAEETGREIRLALEPEPDCALMLGADVLEYFGGPMAGAGVQECRQRLGEGADASEVLRRHIGVCLDACHAAVEFEDPVALLRDFGAAGIGVYKVQLSSALVVDSPEGLKRLGTFAEDRYLHQTRARTVVGVRRWRDLPEALAELEGVRGGFEARTHFHLPLTWDGDGVVGTTRASLEALCRELAGRMARGEWDGDVEVETYTWDVMPRGMRPGSLHRAIAEEVLWANRALGLMPAQAG